MFFISNSISAWREDGELNPGLSGAYIIDRSKNEEKISGRQRAAPEEQGVDSDGGDLRGDPVASRLSATAIVAELPLTRGIGGDGGAHSSDPRLF